MKAKTYLQKICGYNFRAIELGSGCISFGAPMGKGKTKEMFDKLVYYNQNIYNGKTKDKKKIINNIENFIKINQ